MTGLGLSLRAAYRAARQSPVHLKIASSHNALLAMTGLGLSLRAAYRAARQSPVHIKIASSDEHLLAMTLRGLDQGDLVVRQAVELVDELVDLAVGGGDLTLELLVLLRGIGGLFV